MNTRELITEAWYTSGIVSRDLDNVSGSQAIDGLRHLNGLLSEKSMSTRYIPYYGHTQQTLTPGQEVYTFTNLVAVDTITFNIGSLRYALRRTTRRPYFGEGRVDNIDSLPYQYYFEREKDGGKIYLYFRPSEAFELKITGKFSLTQVAIDDDLDLILDRFYQSYLIYQLAKRLCAFYNLPFLHGSILKEIEEQIVDITPNDYSITKISTLKKTPALNWADVNFPSGFRP